MKKTPESFWRTFEKRTQAVNHDEERKCNYERNVHILKMGMEALILRAEQGLAQRYLIFGKLSSDNDDDNMKKFHHQNFLTIIETFAKFDIIIKDQCIYNYKAKMLLWNI